MLTLLKKGRKEGGGEEGGGGEMGEGWLQRCHPEETYSGTHVWGKTKGGWRKGGTSSEVGGRGGGTETNHHVSPEDLDSQHRGENMLGRDRNHLQGDNF